MEEFIFLFSDSVGDHRTILLVVLVILFTICHASHLPLLGIFPPLHFIIYLAVFFYKELPINCSGKGSYRVQKMRNIQWTGCSKKKPTIVTIWPRKDLFP